MSNKKKYELLIKVFGKIKIKKYDIDTIEQMQKILSQYVETEEVKLTKSNDLVRKKVLKK